MTTPQTAPESHEDNEESLQETLIMEGVEPADSVLNKNKEENFEQERIALADFDKWVGGEIKELEADIAAVPCPPAAAN